MLSRVANCLYWMNRYLERADNTARLVDVNLQLLLDRRGLDERTAAVHWIPIVQSAGDETLFASLHVLATAETVTEFLVFQPENPNSILGAVSQARENARMVRDQITSEVWEEINRLYLYLRTSGARAQLRFSPVEFFQVIKASSLHLQGLTDATVLHNEGWLFQQAGKYLERADKTSRILDVRHASFPLRGAPEPVNQAGAVEWAAVLRSCTAWDAYRTIYGAEVLPGQAAEFLLLSPDFPRSVRYCVQRLNTSLRRISGVTEGCFTNDAEKLAGRLLAELQFGTATEIFDAGLHSSIDVLQTKLNDIGVALFQTYIFQPFLAPDNGQLQQQEEQQQQVARPAPRPMKLHVFHRTSYIYATPVRESFNEARLQPVNADSQICHSFLLKVIPATRLSHYLDFQLNWVHLFDINEPHASLTVEATSLVSTAADRVLAEDLLTTPLAEMEKACGRLDRCHDFLRSSRFVDPSVEAWRLAIDISAGLTDAWLIAEAIMHYLHREFVYMPAATHVHTHMRDVLRLKRGVCQDFAHVMLGICRSLNIPARYVSGYLYNGPADQLRGAQASHAWVEVYLPDLGWRGLDPTNNCQPDDRYVKVAVGRDYADVTPITGTYRGTAQRKMSVDVLVTESEPAGVR